MKFCVFDSKIYTSELLISIYNKNVLEINRAVAEVLISRMYIGYGFIGYEKSYWPKNIYSKTGKYLHTRYNIDTKKVLNEQKGNQIKEYAIN